MENKIIFIDHITSIKLHPKRIENFYLYNKEKSIKIFGYKIIFRKPGFYNILGEFTSKERLLEYKNYYIENDVLYFKPYICFNMDNGHNHFKYFENIDEMNDYLDSEKIRSLKRL